METLQIEETKQREMNVWEVKTIKTQPHRFHVNTGLKSDVCYQPLQLLNLSRQRTY